MPGVSGRNFHRGSIVKVQFGQIYVEAGVDFPFSHHFQRRIADDVSALVEPSSEFTQKYGSDFELMFRVSAKKGITDHEVRGPTVFKRTKDVEYTIFLPFDIITRQADAPRQALKYLLKGVYDVFDSLGIDTSKLLADQDHLIEGICSDPAMLSEPSWDEAQNQTVGWTLFKAFFDRIRRD